MTSNLFLSIVVGTFFLTTASNAAQTMDVVHLKIRGVVAELAKYDSPSENQMFWGEYASAPEMVERFHYHFFPDKKFIVAASCDLCSQTPIAEGTFEFTRGEIRLKYLTKKGQRLLASPLYALHGYANPIGDADKKYEIIIMDSDNYSRAIRGKQDFNFIRRVEPYRDWNGIYARLKEREKTYGPMMTPDGYPKAIPPK